MKPVVAPGLLAVLNLAACQDGPGGDQAVSIAQSALTNTDVMTRLKVNCEQCHAPGATKPYFASLTAFEEGVVNNPHYVVAGQPDQSQLVALLAGQAMGQFKQMPIVGDTFARLAMDGRTMISMQEIRDWITALKPTSMENTAYRKASTIRRQRTEQILTGLNLQLGLADADVFSVDSAGQITGAKDDLGQGVFPALSPDGTNASANHGDSYTFGSAYGRFPALGGPSWMGGVKRSNDLGATFLQTFVPLSQARCRLAASKSGNSVFFKYAKASDTTKTDPAAVRENIAYLFFNLFAERPTDAELDSLYNDVFMAYETKSAQTAWTAVCTVLIRDPRWLGY